MMSDNELKMRGEFDALKNAIEQTDFEAETLKGIKQGTEEEMKIAEEIIPLAEASEATVTENIGTINDFIRTQAPAISREEFMFPNGKASAVYEKQLEALRFADGCTQLCVVLENVQDSFEDLRKMRDNNFEKFFGETYSDKEKLSESSAETFPVFECVQKTVCQQLETTKSEIKENCRKAKQKYQTQKPSIPYLEHRGKKIGIACGIFFGLLAAFGMFTVMITDMAVRIPLIVVPPVGVTLVYLAIILIPYFMKCRQYKKDMCLYTESEALCAQADAWTEEITEAFDKKIQFDTIKSRACEEVIIPLFKAWVKAGNYVDKVYKSIQKTVEEAKERIEKAVAFLPPKFPRKSLTGVIECMEEGRASDYKSALCLLDAE